MACLLRALRASAAAAALLLAAGQALAADPPSADEPIATLQAAFSRAVPPGTAADQHRDLIATVLKRVQRSHASEVDLPAFVGTAVRELEKLPPGSEQPHEAFSRSINAALRTLDPYSRYLDPRAQANDRELAGGSFSGLGLEVEAGNGAVRVVAPIPGGPAARAGVRPGDLIVRLDDQPLADVPLADAIARMRGPTGTTISLTLRRAGDGEEFTLALTRETIRRQAVRWHMEGEVLVLRLGLFGSGVAASLQQAITEAGPGTRAVVLDLRGNPGGLLREAVLTADTFLGTGEIVSLRGRAGATQRSWKAEPAELLAGLPMVVLVDRRSASASELVAAALQENGRAAVMGQRSFGKGTVQSTFGLGTETSGTLKLTTSIYHGPSGRTVQKAGVAPDIELVAAVPAEAADAASKRVEQGRCAAVYKAADPAVACAVAFLRAGSVEAFVGQVAAPPH